MSSSIGDADNKFGEYCSNGDILGCSLDMETKTIQYWRNGKDLGVAFSNVAPGIFCRCAAAVKYYRAWRKTSTVHWVVSKGISLVQLWAREILSSSRWIQYAALFFD